MATGIAKQLQRLHTGVVLAYHIFITVQAFAQLQRPWVLILALKRAGHSEVVKKHLNQRPDSISC